MHLTACLDTYDLFFFFLLLKSLQSKCVVILNLQFHLRSMPNISCHFHKVNVFRLSKEQCIYLINLGKLKQGNTSFPSVFLLLGIQRNNPPSGSITTYSPILLFLSVPIAYQVKTNEQCKFSLRLGMSTVFGYKQSASR